MLSSQAVPARRRVLALNTFDYIFGERPKSENNYTRSFPRPDIEMGARFLVLEGGIYLIPQSL